MTDTNKRKTLIKRLILIVIIAFALFALFIPTRSFAQSTGPIDPCKALGNCIGGVSEIGNQGIKDGTTTLILKAARFLVYIGAAIAVLFIVLGGYSMITSNGDSSKQQKGMETLKNAVIGLVVIIVSFTIVSLVANLVTKTNIGLFNLVDPGIYFGGL